MHRAQMVGASKIDLWHKNSSPVSYLHLCKGPAYIETSYFIDCKALLYILIYTHAHAESRLISPYLYISVQENHHHPPQRRFYLGASKTAALNLSLFGFFSKPRISSGMQNKHWSQILGSRLESSMLLFNKILGIDLRAPNLPQGHGEP